MSYAKRIIGSMKFDQPYREDEIEAMTNLPREEVKRACNLLVNGGVLEQVGMDKVKRRKERKFKSKQRELFA